MNSNYKILKRVRRFVNNPINVLFVAMAVIGEIILQAKLITNIGETFLMSFAMMLIMLFVFPNVSWTKPYFTLPWKDYTVADISQKESMK